jgi:hypothetical protein
MSVPLLLAVAAITIGSRAAALAVLPPPHGRAADIARRLPAPLCAALAALSITVSGPGPTNPALLAAVCCALLSTRWSSLLITLVAGLGGFVLASLVW